MGEAPSYSNRGVFMANYIYEDLSIDGKGFANDETGAWDISQASRETVDYGSDKYQNSLVSWTGRVSYAYNDRYLLTATARYDGSSRFGANNKWGFSHLLVWLGVQVKRHF